MKKLFILPIVFFLVVLPVLAVKDLTVTGAPTITARLNETFSDSFSVQNIGDETINNINFVVSSILSDFSLSFDPENFNLRPGELISVEVSGRVPNKKEIGKYTGSVYVNGEGVTREFKLTIDVKGMLDIIDFDAEAGDRHWDDVSNGNNLAGIRPGTTLKLVIELKNRFSSDSDIDINDVTVTATIRGIDDNEDVEKETEELDIRAGGDEKFNLELPIPSHAEDDDYSMDIVAEGRDDNGVKHKVEWELNVGVKREAHSLKIDNIRITPATVSCTRRATISIDVVNLGRNDEDTAIIEVSNAALGINEREMFKIESDVDKNQKTLSFPISAASTTREGTYPITVRLFYQADQLMDIKVANWIIEGCGTTPLKKPEEPEPTEPEKEQEKKEQITGGAIYIEKQEGAKGTVINIGGKKESFLGSNNYLVIILIASVILIILIVTLVVRFLI